MSKQVNWDLEGAAFYAQFGYNVAGLNANQLEQLELAVERACWEIDGYRNRDGDLVAPTQEGIEDPRHVVAAYIGGQFEELGVEG